VTTLQHATIHLQWKCASSSGESRVTQLRHAPRNTLLVLAKPLLARRLPSRSAYYSLFALKMTALDLKQPVRAENDSNRANQWHSASGVPPSRGLADAIVPEVVLATTPSAGPAVPSEVDLEVDLRSSRSATPHPAHFKPRLVTTRQ
jgi:hypothetical protein